MTKRYDEYKDSGIEWLGEIPSHWDTIRLKDKISISSGKSAIKTDDGYLLYGANGIIGRTNNYNIDRKKIIIGRVGSCGAINIAKERSFISDNALIVDEKAISFDYLYYLLINKNLVNLASKVAMPLITATGVLEEKTPFINNKSEQQSIANYLDNKISKIDIAVSELEKQKSLLIELKKSTIHQAVTKGLDLTVPMKDSGVEWIGEVPSHWDMKRIKDKLINLGGGKYGEDEGKLDLDIPCISISDFRNGNISTNKKIKMKRSYSISNIMKKGTLLVEKSGGGEKNPVGRVIMIEKDIEAYYTNFVASLKTLENEKFCCYLMKNIHNRRVHMPFVKQNTGLQNFDYNGFSLFQKVVFPSKLEQNEIVNYLDKKTDQIDQSIKVIDNQIAKMKEYKKTLINDVVTGKIKVV